MKQITNVLFFFFLVSVATATNGTKKQIQLIFEGANCGTASTMSLFQFNGTSFQFIQKATAQEKLQVIDNKQVRVFELSIDSSDPRFYYLGFDAQNIRPLILGDEEVVRIRGNCQEMRSARVIESDLNTAYSKLRGQFKQMNGEMNQYVRRYRSARDSVSRAQIVASFAKLDQRRLDLITSLEATQPYLAKVAATQTYLSFFNYGDGYTNEIDYFSNEYFHFVDWKDEAYNYMAWVYESMKTYTETIGNFRLSDTKHKDLLEMHLGKMPEGSRTKQLAWSAIITALQAKSHPNFAHFAKGFMEKYKEIDPEAVAIVAQKVKQAQSFMAGGEAPDFEMAKPDGEMMKMSDLRGKVVLVDFWASWCGPCRKENPNVVKLYEKYKDKGFDILGVSLDSNKERWLKAIEDDKLVWHHVGDLKGWKNSAAQLYSVRSIPHTMLLDAEGKIIGRNYRGHALEAKLREIFGE